MRGFSALKKIILFLFIYVTLPVFASENIHVEALQDFSSLKPAHTFKVKVLKPIHTDFYSFLEGDTLTCTLYKTTDPTRGKRDAQIYFMLSSYADESGAHPIEHKILARYSKNVLNVEAIKSIPPKTAVKKTAGVIGNHFLAGVSYGISFVDGVATNSDGNRLKSGAKQVYDDSFLSLVEKGEEVVIEKGDTFYLVTKLVEEEGYE